MDSNIEILLDRANNELLLARAIRTLSSESKIKAEIFNLPQEITFYSAVIAHAYYSIFYSAKAYLISKAIYIPEQGQHNAVYQKFKKIVKTGDLPQANKEPAEKSIENAKFFVSHIKEFISFSKK